MKNSSNERQSDGTAAPEPTPENELNGGCHARLVRCSSFIRWWRAPERVLTLVNVFGVLVLMQGIGIGTLIYRDLTRVEVAPDEEHNTHDLNRGKSNSEDGQPLDSGRGNPLTCKRNSVTTAHDF